VVTSPESATASPATVVQQPPLHVLVVVHSLEVGGSQMNAIDIGGRLAAQGHRITLAGPAGPLAALARERGLELEIVPELAFGRPVESIRTLRRLADRHRPDLVHSYEIVPAVLCYLGLHQRDGLPLVMTVNSMSVPDFLPTTPPLLVCSPLIASQARRRTGEVEVLEIPTDTDDQTPDWPAGSFRADYGVGEDELLVLIVSRLVPVLKLDGILAAVRAVDSLADRLPVRLFIAGSGPSAPQIAALADQVNARHGRPVVVLGGEILDPRPAYASADVVVGMGGSLLRAMAFGKPCVVQGERGFFEPLTAETARPFLWHGFYGVGAGDDGAARLAGLLEDLLTDASRRAELGEFSLALSRSRYSLRGAADQQLQIYRSALREQAGGQPARADAVRCLAGLGRFFAGRLVARARRRLPADAYNSREVIQDGITAPPPDDFLPDAAAVRTAAGWS
jgi:glycosyltransferase involved in cell wall biosynthesis